MAKSSQFITHNSEITLFINIINFITMTTQYMITVGLLEATENKSLQTSLHNYYYIILVISR